MVGARNYLRTSYSQWKCYLNPDLRIINQVPYLYLYLLSLPYPPNLDIQHENYFLVMVRLSMAWICLILSARRHWHRISQSHGFSTSQCLMVWFHQNDDSTCKNSPGSSSPATEQPVCECVIPSRQRNRYIRKLRKIY